MAPLFDALITSLNSPTAASSSSSSMSSRRTRVSSRGASTLGPISEIPAPATMAAKFSTMTIDSSSSPPPAEVDRWEVRPGGMLVQKRDPGSDADSRPPPPPIRVKVKYGSAYHQIRISPQATFGELKKLLAADTGLHPQGQRLLYKDKERDSSAFLDMSGVKDGSKLVLQEDPSGQARRSLELRRDAKMEQAAKSIQQVARDVDKLVGQVKILSALVSKGKKVAEKDLVGVTEQLMNQVLKLDAVVADGEVKTQRRIQVKRVQKYVETLDDLKLKNAQITGVSSPAQPPVTLTTKWESFDLLSSMPSSSAPPPPPPTPPQPQPPVQHVKFNWELF